MTTIIYITWTNFVQIYNAKYKISQLWGILMETTAFFKDFPTHLKVRPVTLGGVKFYSRKLRHFKIDFPQKSMVLLFKDLLYTRISQKHSLSIHFEIYIYIWVCVCVYIVRSNHLTKARRNKNRITKWNICSLFINNICLKTKVQISIAHSFLNII